MARDLAQLTLVGSVQPRDGELRYAASGQPVLRWRMVANRSRKSATGDWTDESDWYQVTLFGTRAESFLERVVKGARLLVVGSFATRQYTDREGAARTALEVIAETVLVLDRQPAEGAPGGLQERPAADMIDDLPF